MEHPKKRRGTCCELLYCTDAFLLDIRAPRTKIPLAPYPVIVEPAPLGHPWIKESLGCSSRVADSEPHGGRHSAAGCAESRGKPVPKCTEGILAQVSEETTAYARPFALQRVYELFLGVCAGCLGRHRSKPIALSRFVRTTLRLERHLCVSQRLPAGVRSLPLMLKKYPGSNFEHVAKSSPAH